MRPHFYAIGLTLACTACGFEALERAPEGPPAEFEDMAGSVLVDGIRVRPEVIHPGDQVTLRDPVVLDPSAQAPLYFWDACAGALTPGAAHDREATWVAPMEPGTYAVTVNIVDFAHDRRSRVVRLCVAAPGEETCTLDENTPPELRSLAATPGLFNQARDCGADRCAADVGADVMTTGADTVAFRWGTRQGRISGSGALVRWELPEVGCCTESFFVSLTACDSNGGAVTGVTSVVVIPE